MALYEKGKVYLKNMKSGAIVLYEPLAAELPHMQRIVPNPVDASAPAPKKQSKKQSSKPDED